MTTKTKAAPVIDWQVDPDATDDIDRLTLIAGPVPRLIPEGVRVQVVAFHDSRDRHRQEPEIFRVASVSLVDSDGMRDKTGASTRFGNTDASGSCWARVEEGRGFWRDGGEEVPEGYVYWRTTQVTGWRLDGFASDLPDGAMQAMRDTFVSAAEFAAKVAPEKWQGGDLKAARQAVGYAERDAAKAREEEKAARAKLRKAETAYRRASS